MPRAYKRKAGSRRSNDHNPNDIEKSLEKVVDYGWSLCKAAKLVFVQ